MNLFLGKSDTDSENVESSTSVCVLNGASGSGWDGMGWVAV